MSKEAVYRGVVTNILEGDDGWFAFAETKELGTVTFSFRIMVWKEENTPKVGNVVCLKDVRKHKGRKRFGWRAYDVCFWRPEHEFLETSHDEQLEVSAE